MSKNGLIHRLVLATLLTLGFLLVWGMIGVWSIEMLVMVAALHSREEHLSFLADGSAVVAHPDNRGKTTYRNLAGEPVAAPENEQFGWLDRTWLPPHSARRNSGYVSWDERIHTFDDGRTPRVVWHFVSDGRPEGTAYFVGYDSLSKARVGYLGTAGFHAKMPPPEELFPFGRDEAGAGSLVFSPDRKRTSRGDHSLLRIDKAESEAESGRWVVYVFGRDRKLYQADLRKGTVRILLDEPGLRFVALMAVRQTAPQMFSDRLAVRTEDAVLVLDSRGGIQNRYPIPEVLRNQTFTFGETTTGEAVMCSNSEQDIFLTEVAYRICHVTTDGRIREEAITLSSEHPMRSSLRVVGAAVVPAPVVLDAFVALFRAGQLCDLGDEPTYSVALLRSLREFWPSLALAQLMAALLAWLCHRRQVRYGASRTERWVWPLFVLLFGLPGWIGYRFGRSWPALESCSECGASVPRDRVECARCEAEFAPPMHRGTEVFA